MEIQFIKLSIDQKRAPLSSLHEARLYNKVAYSRCAPIFGNYRLLSIDR